jgi:hypothetical protein
MSSGVGAALLEYRSQTGNKPFSFFPGKIRDRAVHDEISYGQSQIDYRAAAPPQRRDSKNFRTRHALPEIFYSHTQAVYKTSAKNHL